MSGAPRLPRHRWPWGPARPGPLTEAELDRANAAKACAHLPLPELLLRKGAMTAHPAPTWMQRLRKWWADRRLARMGPRGGVR